MDVRRITLIAGLAIVSYLMIFTWSNDYSNTKPVAQETSAATSAVTPSLGGSDVPAGNVDTETGSGVSNQPVSSGNQVKVFTDTLNVIIDLNGGDVISAALPQYPASLETLDSPFKILESGDRTYNAQSGLVGADGVDTTTRARYTAVQNRFDLNGGQLEVRLSHVADSGLSVDKVYTFTQGSYLIGLRFELTNNSSRTLTTNMFAQLRRDKSDDPSSMGGIGMNSYLGTTFSTVESAYEKVSFKDLEKEKYANTSTGGWVAIIQHYFLTAWVPGANDTNSFYGEQGGNGLYYAGFKAPTLVIAPGETAQATAGLYVGPKDQDALIAVAKNLEKTVDYGWLWWIAQPIFKLMQFIQGLVGNWGWSIVLMTLLLKLMLYPLTSASYRSMAKMRKFTPKIQELRELYGDDRARMSQETMKLYQKEKLNPLGGCLPMLVQMPVFIALYWVLMESVELRQSPFMFWIVDLSIKDPFFVLPLLMGGSMFVQMQMQQQPSMDPMQAKIMKFMPVMFTFMFLWFPAGLTLYWFINNLSTITQQHMVNKSVARADAKLIQDKLIQKK
ncbi:MAG: YidC/Oxa1 family membrane protein insertase [Reinekea sp.]|jgi:YidC/Oxa1 family membrane protein insertase